MSNYYMYVDENASHYIFLDNFVLSCLVIVFNQTVHFYEAPWLSGIVLDASSRLTGATVVYH